MSILVNDVGHDQDVNRIKPIYTVHPSSKSILKTPRKSPKYSIDIQCEICTSQSDSWQSPKWREAFRMLSHFARRQFATASRYRNFTSSASRNADFTHAVRISNAGNVIGIGLKPQLGHRRWSGRSIYCPTIGSKRWHEHAVDRKK